MRDSPDNDLGEAVATHIDVLTKLSRYERQLERSFYTTWDQLTRARADRHQAAVRRAVAATAPIDVGTEPGSEA